MIINKEIPLLTIFSPNKKDVLSSVANPKHAKLTYNFNSCSTLQFQVDKNIFDSKTGKWIENPCYNDLAENNLLYMANASNVLNYNGAPLLPDGSYQLFVSNYHDDKKALLLLEIIKIMIENKVIELENDNDISYINNAMNKIKNGEHASTGEIKIKINLDEVELYSGNEEFCYKKIKSNILKRNVKRHLITISILLSMFVLIGLIISFPYTFIAICIILALLTGLVYLYRFIFKLVKRKIG